MESDEGESERWRVHAHCDQNVPRRQNGRSFPESGWTGARIPSEQKG